MPYSNMKFRLQGEIPGLDPLLAGSLINEALQKIYDEVMWSFQIKEAGWLTPGLQFASNLLSSGTITASAYSNQIVGNSTAAAAWNAMTGRPLITELQIRVPQYSLYNVIAYDGVNTLTIDRPWTEPAGAGLSYMIYQAYFPVPASDFKRFLEIRDTTLGSVIDYWTYSRRDLAMLDPQRTIFNNPGYAVPIGADHRVGSSTLGWMMIELWPHPLSILPYTFSYLRGGDSLTLNSDTIPWPLTEDLVVSRAKECACLYKEAHKGEDTKRGSGADWRFLAQANNAEYLNRLKDVKNSDRDMIELYFNRFVRNASLQGNGEPYYSNAGSLNVGRW
jgi:hypothetical protein